MPEMPEYMTEQGIEAGRLYPEDIVAAANRLGQDLFEIETVVRFFYQPWIYLDTTKIDAAGLSADEVRSRISVALGREKGIALAVARNELSEPQPTSIRQQIQRSFHPERSGDIYVVQRPYWFSFSKGPIGLAHGSPWNYDTHVPIIFAGAGVPQARVQRLVHPVDVAPTLSAFFGMTAPAAASGTILIEVLP